MEREREFMEYLAKLKVSEAVRQSTLAISEDYLGFAQTYPNKAGVQALQDFCQQFVVGREDAYPRLVALARLCKFTQRQAELIHILTSANTLGVIESMELATCTVAGDEAAHTIFDGLGMPPIGSPQSAYPPAVNEFLRRLTATLSDADCKRVLVGNHHQVDPSHFAEDKRKFQELGGSIDAFLAYRHAKTLADMRQCLQENRLWYEQTITPEVIAYIEAHPEVQTGVREGGRIVISKIPYKVDEYLRETDPARKRYLACHCPFVRASLLPDAERVPESVPDTWCNCTGGFTKLIFDVIYEQDTQVELLESVLSGGSSCKFAITIPPAAFGLDDRA